MLTQGILKENLHYNFSTGVFTWLKANSRRIKIGDIAGCFDKTDGYIRITINYKLYQAHRLAWLYVHGEMPVEQLDHLNHDRIDNRIDNLRCVTRQENLRNRTMNSNNSSGFTGVVWYEQRKKWCAQIKINGKKQHLGYFTNLEDAIATRKSANLKYNFHINHGVNNDI